MKRTAYLFSIVIICILFVNVDARPCNQSQVSEPLIAHDISLQAMSWKAFEVYCVEGDTLSGSFKITRDGDLFIGDQTKYDNWLSGGIDFLIMNEETFYSWSQGLSIDAGYERKGIAELTWSYDVPSTGKWYVVYFNDSIYIKRIEGSVSLASPSNPTVPLILLASVSALALAGLYVAKKKK